MYMAWGANAVAEAMGSIESLRRHDLEIPVLVLGDARTREKLVGAQNVQVEIVGIDPFRKPLTYKGTEDKVEFLAGRLIETLYEISPWDRTLYLDVDTEFLAPPRQMLRFLDRWDFAVAETPNRALNSYMGDRREFAWSGLWLGDRSLLYHNAGVLAWRRKESVGALFRLWAEEWVRFENWDPQVALLRALARSEVQFLTLPWTWNCAEREEAYFVYHRYGLQNAWKTPWSNIEDTINEDLPDQS